MKYAKTTGTTVILTGQVNKAGDVAGPKALEHIVDTSLMIESETTQAHRIIKCVKNRFGSSSEIGVFEMTTEGLVDVANPSALFINSGSGAAR